MAPAQRTVIACSPRSFRQTALKLLHESNSNVLLYWNNISSTPADILSKVDAIFSDIDGTLTSEGSSSLPPLIVEYFRKLHNAGIPVTLVSGKPYEEIAPLITALPPELGVRAIYEKGAFELYVAADGMLVQTHLLSTPELTETATTLRPLMVRHWRTMEATYASEHVSFGWAGTGKHRSVLSIDVFSGEVPKQYELLTGAKRDQLKLKNTALLAAIESDLRTFVDANCRGWQVVHLGNANFEIAPPGIEKDKAIKQTNEYKHAQKVLVLGDSGNDRKMLALRQEPKTVAGLVFHNPATIALVDVADFVTFGIANPYPLLDFVLAA